MTRTHRSLHRIVWPILAAAVAVGFALALWLRPPPEDDDARTNPRPVAMERPA
jgi:hypothetical protein